MLFTLQRRPRGVSKWPKFILLVNGRAGFLPRHVNLCPDLRYADNIIFCNVKILPKTFFFGETKMIMI